MHKLSEMLSENPKEVKVKTTSSDQVIVFDIVDILHHWLLIFYLYKAIELSLHNF